jgi:hypothetical protein
MVPGMTEREWRFVDARRRDWLREMAPPPAVRPMPRRVAHHSAEIVRFSAIRRVVAAVRCRPVALDGGGRRSKPRPWGRATLTAPPGTTGSADA